MGFLVLFVTTGLPLDSEGSHVSSLPWGLGAGGLDGYQALIPHTGPVVPRADQALATLTMRKFCEDKVAAELQPSQRR